MSLKFMAAGRVSHETKPAEKRGQVLLDDAPIRG
jgi:hypothetical protein